MRHTCAHAASHSPCPHPPHSPHSHCIPLMLVPVLAHRRLARCSTACVRGIRWLEQEQQSRLETQKNKSGLLPEFHIVAYLGARARCMCACVGARRCVGTHVGVPARRRRVGTPYLACRHASVPAHARGVPRWQGRADTLRDACRTTSHPPRSTPVSARPRRVDTRYSRADTGGLDSR